MSVDDLEVDLMSFPAGSDDDDGAAVFFKRSAMREEFLRDKSTSSPSECNAVFMTVKDSSFSFVGCGFIVGQVGIESNRNGDENFLGRGRGFQRKPPKNDNEFN